MNREFVVTHGPISRFSSDRSARSGVRVVPSQARTFRMRPSLALRRVERAAALLLFKKVEASSRVRIAHIDPVFFSEDREKKE